MSMATGRRPEPRSWRKENDAGNQQLNFAAVEDEPLFWNLIVPRSFFLAVVVPFEELLARELRKSDGNDGDLSSRRSDGGGGEKKKPFLKKGARGWWMRRSDAKQKVVKHTLTSKGEDEEAAVAPVRRKAQKKQQNSRQQRTPSPSQSPVTTPERFRSEADTAMPSQTLSPPVSPIRRIRYSANDGNAVSDGEKQRMEEFTSWKGASLRSTASNDLMGMKGVRQSYEAKQEREADEMAEFEAIERELAAEKDAYLTERQQTQYHPPPPRELRHFDDRADAGHWGLPYSSFASDLHQQSQNQSHANVPNAAFDDSLDADAHSALVFDDRSSLSRDEWRSQRVGSIDQSRLSDQFSAERHYNYPPSDLSAISFDDSEPWDDGLSFQPHGSTTPEVSRTNANAVLLSPNTNRYGSFDASPRASSGQPAIEREGYALESDEEGVDMLPKGPDSARLLEGNAPVSSLVQHVFGQADQEIASNDTRMSYGNDTDSIASGDSNSEREVPTRALPSGRKPGQNASLSMLKQKLQVKQKPSAAKATGGQSKQTANHSNGRRGGPTKSKTAMPPKAKGKAATATANAKMQRGRTAPPTGSGPLLPVVIEEKLYELEEEVKFYKSETLQLQKRKDYYDQEVKKLARERDEFAQYQQQQRVLIEKEWDSERVKMKKEAKFMDRQWKLRMDATSSQQDRKDRGEVATLKAQIVKMQLDERARASKWKAESDNLRHRVAELEEKNHEQSDEIKFLEKDRLEQWGKYERILKEKQEASKPSPPSTAAQPSIGGESGFRTMDDIFAIKGAAEELLKDWNFPHEEVPPDDYEDQGRASSSSSGFRRGVQSSIADGYNPKRYSLDRADSDPNEYEDDFKDGEGVGDVVNSSDYARGGSDTAFKWAFPSDLDLRDDDIERKPEAGDDEAAGAVSASTSSLSESKMVDREIEHPGGKRELLYTDGSRRVVFPDGNEKEIGANGHVVIKFTNGDHKELSPDTGISVYYYYEAQTKLTTYPDEKKVYEFPNQQIETSLPDGTTEIQFADGIKKTIRPNGDEFSVFPDGTTMLEQQDGLREVTLLNQKKIRYFPDGQMACVTPSGLETRVRSDAELKQLMESF
ncbi:hypothetical protein BBJ28_00007864 [Nothophytophthora sp. Chile5]|nr:hypothetical protein BBJ28_00007864 [Nothophytophthora sp. Chile5]